MESRELTYGGICLKQICKHILTKDVEFSPGIKFDESPKFFLLLGHSLMLRYHEKIKEDLHNIDSSLFFWEKILLKDYMSSVSFYKILNNEINGNFRRNVINMQIVKNAILPVGRDVQRYRKLFFYFTEALGYYKYMSFRSMYYYFMRKIEVSEIEWFFHRGKWIYEILQFSHERAYTLMENGETPVEIPEKARLDYQREGEFGEKERKALWKEIGKFKVERF